LSRNKDIARAVVGHPFRNHKPAPVEYLKCGKCGAVIPEYLVTEHLVGTETKPGCQPIKTECGKCKAFIPSIDFLKHFKNCRGKLPVNHKGEQCEYSAVLCKEGFCSECLIFKDHQAKGIENEVH